MADREKVIKGLECCISEKMCHVPCPYNGECDEKGYYYSKAIDEAIALLKAQEPRVLTLEEVKACENPVYLECRVFDCWALPCTVDKKMLYIALMHKNGAFTHFSFGSYGKSWRCWSARPTAEQMKEVEWDA